MLKFGKSMTFEDSLPFFLIDKKLISNEPAGILILNIWPYETPQKFWDVHKF